MIIRINPKMRNGYLLSTAVHLVIIIFFAIIYIKPNLPLNWHVFEWELPQPKPNPLPAAAKGVSVPSSQTIDTKQPETVSQTSPSTSQPVTPTTPPRIIDSPVVDAAPARTDAQNSPKVSRSRSSSALRNIGTNTAPGSFGFAANMESGSGDAYVISQPKPNIVPTQDGEVLLEFYLTSRGEVDMESLTVVSYSSGAYVEAVRKVIGSWRFGFRGAYNPNRLYRIRCSFVVNER